MTYMLSDYVENYYIPIMKLDKESKSVKDFIDAIKQLEARPENIAENLLKAYRDFIDYIRKDLKDYRFINLHFSRMRYDIQTRFSVNLEYVYFQ
jgi:hypothetical protein